MQKYDLHTHFFTNWEKGKFSLERKPRSVKNILDAMKKKNLDGIVLSNAGMIGGWATAFEQLTEASKDKERLGAYRLVKKLDNALEFVNNEKSYKIIKGQEILTKQGHILAVGLDYGEIIPSSMDLCILLKDERYKRAISIAAHPFGIGGIGIKNLEKYRKSFDIYEKNMNYEHTSLSPKIGINPSEEELNELSKKLEINWIAVSDCHNHRDVGNGYIEVEDRTLDFSNKNNLVDSLKDVLVNRKFTPVIKRANSLTSVLSHVIIYFYDEKIRKKLGFVNLEEAY